MNILYVCREYPESQRAGGIGSYCKEIAHGMLSIGHQVTVLTASDDTRVFSDRVEDGIRVIRLDGGDFWVNSAEPGSFFLKFRMLYRFYSFRKRIRDKVLSLKNIDLIEVGDYGAEGLFLDEVGIPVVVRLHTPSLFDCSTQRIAQINWKNGFMVRAEQKILQRARYITSCSQCLLDWLCTHLSVNAHLSEVILNPVSFRVSKEFISPVTDKSVRVVFYAGTIVPTKGVGDLIEACKVLREQKGYPVLLLMAGKEGAYASQQKMNLTPAQRGYIRFLGKLKREDLYAYYHFADVCCFPSWWENMPMVCLEAMMCRGLVVGSSSGGMREIIEDGTNGFLVPHKSVDDLVHCLEKVFLLSHAEVESVKQKAMDTIQEKFDIQLIAQQMDDFYQRVICDYKINHS